MLRIDVSAGLISTKKTIKTIKKKYINRHRTLLGISIAREREESNLNYQKKNQYHNNHNLMRQFSNF